VLAFTGKSIRNLKILSKHRGGMSTLKTPAKAVAYHRKKHMKSAQHVFLDGFFPHPVMDGHCRKFTNEIE
jgi:hypothetical protein